MVDRWKFGCYHFQIMDDEYRRALESLAAGARVLEKTGTDGVEIKVRDCAGRVKGAS